MASKKMDQMAGMALAVMLLCSLAGGASAKAAIRGTKISPNLRTPAKPTSTVSLARLNEELDTAVTEALGVGLAEALGEGHGVDKGTFETVEARMKPTFDSLHKNQHGRVELSGLRYLMHRYFAEGHGWQIKGFEKATSNDGEVGSGKPEILVQKLPGYVESVLEARLNHQGFDLRDAVTMVLALERLIFDSGLQHLETAFAFRDLTSFQDVGSAADLTEVMRSFVMMYATQISGAGLTSKYAHDKAKEALVEEATTKDNKDRTAGGEWQPHNFADAEVNQALWQKEQANPFAFFAEKDNTDGGSNHLQFSFREAAKVADKITEDFGRFQNDECSMLRDGLALMDTSGNGRIPFKDFAGKRVRDFVFLEPESYLRELGTLDESDKEAGPQVVIPNYVSSLSNCVEASDFYSVCCLDPCEGVMRTLEREVRAPTATVEQLVGAMGQVHTDRMEEPRNLTAGSALRGMLEEVGEASDGSINLHGRLLAQFLHYAYPHECPYPVQSGVAKPKTAKEWEKTNAGEEGREKINWGAASNLHDLTDHVKQETEKAAEVGELVVGDLNKEPEKEERTNRMARSSNPKRKKTPTGWSLEEELFSSSKKASGTSSGQTWTSKLSFVGLVIFGLIVGAAKMRGAEKGYPGLLMPEQVPAAVRALSSPAACGGGSGGNSNAAMGCYAGFFEEESSLGFRALSSPTTLMKRRGNAGGGDLLPRFDVSL